MLFKIVDKEIEITSEQIGSILDVAYYGAYSGEDTIEDFIDWFNRGCLDEELEDY